MTELRLIITTLILAVALMTGCSEQKSPVEKAGDKASEAMQAAKEEAVEVKEKAAEGMEAVKETAADTMEAAKEKAADVKEKAAEEMKEVKEAAAGTMQAAKEKAADVTEKATETVEGLTAVAPEEVRMVPGGDKIYKARCMACHGASGAGTAMAPAFVKNDWVKDASAVELADVINNGRVGAAKRYKKFALGMPAQKGISGDDMDALIYYIKSLY